MPANLTIVVCLESHPGRPLLPRRRIRTVFNGSLDRKNESNLPLQLPLRPFTKTHLSKTDASEFTKRFRSIKMAWNADVAAQQFEELCQRFEKSYSTFVKKLRKKRNNYLAFLNYPDGVRRTLSTTNAVEALNGQLEILRRNSGGYFQSEEITKLKLGIAISSLENGKWRSVAANMKAALDQFNAMFEARFESE